VVSRAASATPLAGTSARLREINATMKRESGAQSARRAVAVTPLPRGALTDPVSGEFVCALEGETSARRNA
jgi:hypothetical protein